MRVPTQFIVIMMLLGVLSSRSSTQDLAPRAYLVTPNHTNIITLTYSYDNGNILLNGALPITGATASVNGGILNYYHSLNFFGRSANLLVILPYGVGDFSGQVGGTEKSARRSGLMDSEFRFSVNIVGGPTMSAAQMKSWKQKILFGLSLQIVAPTGQYDMTRVINWSGNRWAFKPELGYSQRWGKWVLDGYTGAWFYTTNPSYFSRNALYPDTRSQSQNPLGAIEGHLSYDMRQRLWMSIDGNFWYGGATSVNGVFNPATRQTSSRVGATFSFPLTTHQSMKVSYSNGAYARFGGNYQNVSVGWQYYWLGKP